MIVMEAAWSVFRLFVIVLCLFQFQDMSHKTRSVNVGMFVMNDLCAHFTVLIFLLLFENPFYTEKIKIFIPKLTFFFYM